MYWKTATLAYVADPGLRTKLPKAADMGCSVPSVLLTTLLAQQAINVGNQAQSSHFLVHPAINKNELII